MRAFILFLFTLFAFFLQAESTRFGALGRNDTVVTKESDPIASAAIASETSARQSAVTDLTNKINAESAARTQILSSVEAQLEALKTQKQDAVVSFSSVDNTGVNVGDSNATGALDNMSDVSWIKGSLADFGLGDRAVEPSAITLFRRSGTTTNQNASRILRLLRWNGSAWFVAYQAVSPVVHNDVTINGGRIEHQMEYVAGSARIPANEMIVLCYAPAKSSPVTAVLNFGAKVMATTGTRYLATGQSTTPASPSTAAGWPQYLAMELTVKEYKDVVAVLASRVESVAASADSAQGVAESASATASAAVATADSAKAAASSASNAADGARVIAQAATTTAQSARTTAENAMAKASTVEKTANAAATASDVAVLSERVTALEGRPSGDSGLSERVASVEASISTVSETATAASAAAASASTVAESAKTTATAASATAESAKASAATAQALAVSAAAAAEKAQSTASEASTTASAAMAKASSVEKTANAAATAASVATLSDRVTALENRPSGGVSDADLAAETSARKAADADLSARIESVANNAAGKESVATLQTQLSSLQSDVSDNATAILTAQKTADAATASAAAAISTANIATDTANAASATANVATVTAEDARTAANSAVATVSEIEGRMDSVYKIAEEARVASAVITDLAPDLSKAIADANEASSKVLTFSNRVDSLSKSVTGMRTEVSQYRNDVSNYKAEALQKTCVSDTDDQDTGSAKSELIYDSDVDALTIRLGDGLKRESVYVKNLFQGYRLAADFSPITETGWVHRNAWSLAVVPAESIVFSVSETTNVTTNDFGQVLGISSVTRQTSGARGVYAFWIDPNKTSGAEPSFSVSEGATISKTSNMNMSCLISAEQEGLYRVTATKDDGSSHEIFVPIRSQTATSTDEVVYLSDSGASARKAANDAMLAILQRRDRTTTAKVGVTEKVATKDFYASSTFTSWTWNDFGPMPKEYACFTYAYDRWGPPHTPVAPHYLITAEHWKPKAVDDSRGIILFLDNTNNHHGISTIRGTSLAAWARANGYTEAEIAEANIYDLYVWTTKDDEWSVFSDNLIPHVMDRSALDHYYNGSLDGIACYALTQDMYVTYSAFNSDYGDRWCLFGEDYAPQHVRADILEQLTPSACSKIYGGDSGRPILFLHNGDTPVLTSIFWTRGYGSSLVKGAEILDAYIKADSGGTESLKRISAPAE